MLAQCSPQLISCVSCLCAWCRSFSFSLSLSRRLSVVGLWSFFMRLLDELSHSWQQQLAELAQQLDRKQHKRQRRGQRPPRGHAVAGRGLERGGAGRGGAAVVHESKDACRARIAARGRVGAGRR
jgi:hypothetical protein